MFVDDRPVQRWVWVVPIVFAIAVLLGIDYADLADKGVEPAWNSRAGGGVYALRSPKTAPPDRETSAGHRRPAALQKEKR